jgi:hypothetical protein
MPNDWPDDPLGTVRVGDGAVAVRGFYESRDEPCWYIVNTSQDGIAEMPKISGWPIIHPLPPQRIMLGYGGRGQLEHEPLHRPVESRAEEIGATHVPMRRRRRRKPEPPRQPRTEQEWDEWMAARAGRWVPR